MKKFFKRLLQVLLVLVILFNAAILISGKTYIYRALAATYLKGRTGPGIEDYTIFANREVKAGTYQPWAISAAYNKKPLAEDELNYHKELGTVAYLVIQNDSILHESYWDGYGPDSRSNSFSMAKSVVSVLVGCAIKDGLIKDVNEPVAKYLPEYKDVTGDKVTIRHLLTMSSGINFDENYANPFGMMAEVYYGKDIAASVKGFKPSTEPGKQFGYLGGNTLLLGFLVEKVTGKALADYASEKIWQPVGAKNTALWSLDKENGTEKSYCCFNSNAQDFARLGRLYLDSGRWNGAQLVPEDYVLSSTRPATDVMDGSHPLEIYGYQWWCMNRNGERIFYARGILGQYIVVRPEKNAIVVRLGHRRKLTKEDGHPSDVLEYIKMSDELLK